MTQHVLPPGPDGKAGPEPARAAVPTHREDEGAQGLAAAGVMQAGEEAHAAAHAVAPERALPQHAPDAAAAPAQVCLKTGSAAGWSHRTTWLSCRALQSRRSYVAQPWRSRLTPDCTASYAPDRPYA